MAPRSIRKTVLLTAVVSSAAFLLPGCILGPREADNSQAAAQFASNEVANMGVDAANAMGGVGLTKEAAAEAETTYVNWQLHPYAWDATSQSFVRSATFSTSNGYQRTRIDTMTFADAAGLSLQHPTLATVKTIHHVRHVTHVRGGDEVNVVFDMNSVVNKGADTTLVKNGTMKGTYAGEEMASGTVTDVTRMRTNGKWQFPSSGTVSATFPKFTYELVYLGGGAARATLTNTVKDKVTITDIQVDER
jgi:hypothetical protein